MAGIYADKTTSLKMVPKMGDVPAGDLDWDMLRSWISRYIDGKLRGFWTLPFTTSGAGDDEKADEPAIQLCAQTLAAGLAQHLRYTEDDPNRMPDNWWWRQGMSQLYEIRAGKIKLDRTKATLLDDDTLDQAKEDVDSTTYDTRSMFNTGDELDWEFGQIVKSADDTVRKDLEDI